MAFTSELAPCIVAMEACCGAHFLGRTVVGQGRISASSVVKWSHRLRANGSAAPGRIGGYVAPKISGEHRDWLMERTRAQAFTLRGLPL